MMQYLIFETKYVTENEKSIKKLNRIQVHRMLEAKQVFLEILSGIFEVRVRQTV